MMRNCNQDHYKLLYGEKWQWKLLLIKENLLETRHVPQQPNETSNSTKMNGSFDQRVIFLAQYNTSPHPF